MKLVVQGNRLYVDGLLFSHCEVKDGHGYKSFSGAVEARYSHHHGRELPISHGIGWLGSDPSCDIVLGRVVKSDGGVLPCRVTEARLIGLVNYATEQGKKITLEIEK